MKIFLNIQLFQKRPSPKQLSEYSYETAKTKRFFVESAKSSLSFFLCGTFCLPFIVVTPASDECLDFGHLPAVIGVLVLVCVCFY